MIKAYFFPFFGGMTGLTFHAIAALMHVLYVMTGQTGSSQILVNFAGMTTLAGDFLMGLLQGEICFVVVIFLDWPPARLRVTIIAFLAQALLMGFLLFVAINTFTCCIAKFNLWLVTGVAAHCLVSPLELKICVFMVEGFAVQADNIHVAALVIGMAEFTFLLPHFLAQSMKAARAPQILGNLLVTVQAQPLLRFFIERFVTILAFFFKLGMTFNKRPGHHQFFKDCLGMARQRHQHADNRNKAQ